MGIKTAIAAAAVMSLTAVVSAPKSVFAEDNSIGETILGQFFEAHPFPTDDNALANSTFNADANGGFKRMTASSFPTVARCNGLTLLVSNPE